VLLVAGQPARASAACSSISPYTVVARRDRGRRRHLRCDGDGLRAAGWLVPVGVVPLYFPTGGRPPARHGWVPGWRSCLGLIVFAGCFSPISNDNALAGAVNPIRVPPRLSG